DCYDNAVMEAFFSTLKTELADRFDSHGQANRELFAYIEAFYNTRRRHSTLDSGVPYNRRCAVLTTAISRLKLSARSKTMWMLPPPVDAQNAPTGVWKSRTEREIPTAPTSIILFSDEEEERRTKPLRSSVHRIGSDHPPTPMTEANQLKELQRASWEDTSAGWERHYDWYVETVRPMIDCVC